MPSQLDNGLLALAGVLSGLALALPVAAEHVEAAATVTDLGMFGGRDAEAHDLGTFGGRDAEAHAIDDDGVIVGIARDGSAAGRARDVRASYRGFVARPGEPLTLLEGPAGEQLEPTASAAGTVAGGKRASNGQIYGGFRWTAAGGYAELSAPLGYARLHATDIAADGTILAHAYPPEGGRTPVLLAPAGEAVVLACARESVNCAANALNEAGDVVGADDDGAVLWTHGTHRRVRLPGHPALMRTWAADIDAGGTIVGVGVARDDSEWVLVWDARDHALRVVGEGTAFAINDHGVIAGQADRRACLWDLPRAARITLAALEGDGRDEYESVAVDVNNAGVAVGSSQATDGSRRAVVWAARPAD